MRWSKNCGPCKDRKMTRLQDIPSLAIPTAPLQDVPIRTISSKNKSPEALQKTKNSKFLLTWAKTIINRSKSTTPARRLTETQDSSNHWWYCRTSSDIHRILEQRDFTDLLCMFPTHFGGWGLNLIFRHLQILFVQIAIPARSCRNSA